MVRSFKFRVSRIVNKLAPNKRGSIRMPYRNLLAGFLLLGTLLPASADNLLEGTKSIKLVEQGGTAHTVATIKFGPQGKGATYKIDWQDGQFADHFLSMRPFKCLEGPKKYWCRVPYPYDNKRKVSSGDLTDLEYDLLFIWKGAKEYGINMWNGVYYKLKVGEAGRITGEIHEMDMDILSAPPDDGNLRPIREVHLEPGETESHWLPKIEID